MRSSIPEPSPLLTFIVVNWNYGRYIASTIDSIKQQDYQNFQCIVIDNGSKDNSIEIIESSVNSDNRFLVVKEQQNVGHLGAILRSRHLIKGDFISIVDLDDFLLPHYASFHLQAHISFELPPGVTTSNLLEISSNGTLVAGHRTIDWSLKVMDFHAVYSRASNSLFR